MAFPHNIWNTTLEMALSPFHKNRNIFLLLLLQQALIPSEPTGSSHKALAAGKTFVSSLPCHAWECGVPLVWSMTQPRLDWEGRRELSRLDPGKPQRCSALCQLLSPSRSPPQSQGCHVHVSCSKAGEKIPVGPSWACSAGDRQAMVSSSRCFDIALGFWTALGNQLLVPRLGKCCPLQRPGDNLGPKGR